MVPAEEQLGGPAEEQRRVVFISARVHPGETPASWIMHGVLDFLTSPADPIAARLRALCVFKVVPMLNPDGVAMGNYRCALNGQDLNRCWERPDVERHAEIYHAKKLLAELPTPASLFLDLHAHSRLPDCFLYGCGALRRGERAALVCGRGPRESFNESWAFNEQWAAPAQGPGMEANGAWQCLQAARGGAGGSPTGVSQGVSGQGELRLRSDCEGGAVLQAGGQGGAPIANMFPRVLPPSTCVYPYTPRVPHA